MKGGRRHQGYTIVEVMVVLAVSGVMFLIAASFTAGKQAKTAFNQGVNSLAFDIQADIDAVVDGQYTDVPLRCSVNEGPPRTLRFELPDNTTKQGTNQQCTFLGILLHFRVDRSDGNDPLSNYDLVYLAGAKTDTGGGNLTQLSHSAITPVSGAVNLTKAKLIPQGLQVAAVRVLYNNGVTDTYDGDHYNFGIIQNYGSLDTVNPSSYASGAQTISLIVDTSLGPNDANLLTQSTVKPATRVIICLTDGVRKAHVTVGDNGNQLKAVADFTGVDLIC
ncbi:MAG: prepilin-type N-terminal cleavage/methylation domain-containing protein [Candidatus Saccharimonadales bacterium]